MEEWPNVKVRCHGFKKQKQSFNRGPLQEACSAQPYTDMTRSTTLLVLIYIHGATSASFILAAVHIWTKLWLTLLKWPPQDTEVDEKQKWKNRERWHWVKESFWLSVLKALKVWAEEYAHLKALYRYHNHFRAWRRDLHEFSLFKFILSKNKQRLNVTHNIKNMRTLFAGNSKQTFPPPLWGKALKKRPLMTFPPPAR